LATSILHLCKIIGKKNTTDLILPKFLQLLKDEDEQVRVAIFKNVGLICDVLGVDTLSQTTMPALNELAVHSNWRIRA
jgi:serine/threonine-protein phosphatase 2A regulatory subunit A